MIIRLVVPCLYSIILGGAWGAIFKKKFSSSLAPAFFLHIILVLISGMAFRSLSVGIYFGIILAVVTIVYCFCRDRQELGLKILGKD